MSMKKITDDVKGFLDKNSKIKSLLVICLVLIFILIASLLGKAQADKKE